MCGASLKREQNCGSWVCGNSVLAVKGTTDCLSEAMGESLLVIFHNSEMSEAVRVCQGFKG